MLCVSSQYFVAFVMGWVRRSLLQDHPFVRQKLLEYVQYLVREYDVDAFRLDTAIYMDKEFLLLVVDWLRLLGTSGLNLSESLVQVL